MPLAIAGVGLGLTLLTLFTYFRDEFMTGLIWTAVIGFVFLLIWGSIQTNEEDEPYILVIIPRRRRR